MGMGTLDTEGEQAIVTSRNFRPKQRSVGLKLPPSPSKSIPPCSIPSFSWGWGSLPGGFGGAAEGEGVGFQRSSAENRLVAMACVHFLRIYFK